MSDLPARYCRACGERLAYCQIGDRCPACQRKAIGHDRPPELPPTFWQTDLMRAALATWHIGKVIRAYRHHPHHGRRPLPQEVVGSWLGLTQAQLSRLENGPTLKDLGRLAHYARTIGIPAPLLWFKLADTPEKDAATPA